MIGTTEADQDFLLINLLLRFPGSIDYDLGVEYFTAKKGYQ